MGDGIVGVEREAEWAVAEFGAAVLGDARRTERLVRLAGVLGARPRAALAEACDDPAMLKAAYRFLENGAIEPQAVLASHAAATVERARGAAVVLAVQDTTHIEWDAPAADAQQEGLWVHSTVALTPDGLALGVLAQEQWTRAVGEQGVAARRRDRAIAEKESRKWLGGLDATNAAARDCPTTHWIAAGDRECDIYDVFRREREANVDLVVRAAQDRALADDPDAGETRLLRARVAARPVGGTYALEVPRQGARPARTAQIAVRWARVEMRPPRSRAAEKLPAVTLWAVWAHEDTPPPGVEALDWLLLTTLPVGDADTARVVLGYYAHRWGIEIFHKVLKSGCAIERRRLAALDHMQRALALYSVIAWRVLTLTLLARAQPDLPCTTLLDDDEWQALYCAIHQTTVPPAAPPSLADATRWIAQLGGFLRRAARDLPGVTVLWRGFLRLADLTLMYRVFHPPRHPPNVGKGKPVAEDAHIWKQVAQSGGVAEVIGVGVRHDEHGDTLGKIASLNAPRHRARHSRIEERPRPVVLQRVDV